MIDKYIKPFLLIFLLITILIPLKAVCGDYEIKEAVNKNGKTFSIECRDVEIKDLLRAIAKENALNLIIADDITASVTLSFDSISLDDALDAILKANRLDYVVSNNIMRVVRADELKKKTKEEEKEYVTKVIGLSYADANKLKNTIKDTVSEWYYCF